MSKLSLEGKKGLIIGVANEHSIAYGCAKIMRSMGAELALTYLNKKAEPHVRPLAEQLGCKLVMPCDVQNSSQVDAVFTQIAKQFGALDFVLHSIAFAPQNDLHGTVLDCSLDGFLTAMDISCHSFIRLCKRAVPLMKEGGSLLTVSYYGSEKVVEHYNIMGPVKAALESTVRYLAVELGSRNIRVNTLSPGAVMTRAASGIAHFDTLIAESQQKSPLHRLISIEDVGYMAAFLASDAARNITGGVHYIDAGYEVVA